jgi:hypothetical protein
MGGLKLFDDENIQGIVDDAILSLLPVLFNSNLIQSFDQGDNSRLSLFGLEKIGKDTVYGYLFAKMNGLVGHFDTSFGLKSKLNSFFSRVPGVQTFDDIQKVLDEMKKYLTQIKCQFQRQIHPGSVDLCTA